MTAIITETDDVQNWYSQLKGVRQHFPGLFIVHVTLHKPEFLFFRCFTETSILQVSLNNKVALEMGWYGEGHGICTPIS